MVLSPYFKVILFFLFNPIFLLNLAKFLILLTPNFCELLTLFKYKNSLKIITLTNFPKDNNLLNFYGFLKNKALKSNLPFSRHKNLHYIIEIKNLERG